MDKIAGNQQASNYGSMIAREAVITHGNAAHLQADFYCHASYFVDIGDVGAAKCAFYGEVERLTE
jgi:hypothetical protein